MHLLCLCHSFVEKALKSERQHENIKSRREHKKKATENKQVTCIKHESKKQSLQQSENKKIINVIEILCFIEKLFCYFVLF